MRVYVCMCACVCGRKSLIVRWPLQMCNFLAKMNFKNPPPGVVNKGFVGHWVGVSLRLPCSLAQSIHT